MMEGKKMGKCIDNRLIANARHDTVAKSKDQDGTDDTGRNTSNNEILGRQVRLAGGIFKHDGRHVGITRDGKTHTSRTG